jgi:hypothetical protein
MAMYVERCDSGDPLRVVSFRCQAERIGSARAANAAGIKVDAAKRAERLF